MDQHRYRRIAVRATAGIGILFTLVAVFLFSEFWRSRAEMNAVLSDLLSARMNQIPEVGSGRRFRIIIMSEAQPPGTRPWEKTRTRWSLLFDKDLRFPEASSVTCESFLLNNVFPSNIRPKLNLPRGVNYVVLSNGELTHMTREEFLERFPDNNNWETFSVSQLGLNFSKTEAILYLDRTCAGLCGGGEYILVRKVNGVWRIADQHVTWSS